MFENFLATTKREQQIKQEDAVCSQVLKYCQEGWPDKHLLPGLVKPYFQFAAELTVQKGLLLKGSRIVIPVSLQLKCWIDYIVLIKEYKSVDKEHINLYGGQG